MNERTLLVHFKNVLNGLISSQTGKMGNSNVKHCDCAQCHECV